MKIPPAVPTGPLFQSLSLPTKLCMSRAWPRVWKPWQVLGAQFFGRIILMKFVQKNPRQQLRIFSVAPCQRSYACPIAQCLHAAWLRLGNTVSRCFSAQAHWWNLSWKTRANSSSRLALLPANEAMHVPSRNVCTPLDKAWAHSFSAQSHWWNFQDHVHASRSLPPNRALPKLFPTVSRKSTMSSLPSRSLPTQHSPRYFPLLSIRPPCRPFRVAPSQRSSSQAISHGFLSAMSTLPYRSLPTELSPSYFPRFPVRLSSLKCRSPRGKVN